jgi:hypothetical protein
VDERFDRQAKNEALLRQVNEQIAALGAGAGGWADSGHQFDFQCECGRLETCDSRVVMTIEEYGRVHGQHDRFALVPGHETPAIEDIVETHERYVIVDKRDPYEPPLR